MCTYLNIIAKFQNHEHVLISWSFVSETERFIYLFIFAGKGCNRKSGICLTNWIEKKEA